MPTFTNKPLYSGISQLNTIGTILYSSSAATSIVTSIRIANTSATNRTVTFYLVPSASVSSSANTIIPNVTINAYGIMTDQSAFVLNPKDSIQAMSDQTASVSVYISGVEIT